MQGIHCSSQRQFATPQIKHSIKAREILLSSAKSTSWLYLLVHSTSLKVPETQWQCLTFGKFWHIERFSTSAEAIVVTGSRAEMVRREVPGNDGNAQVTPRFRNGQGQEVTQISTHWGLKSSSYCSAQWGQEREWLLTDP